MFAGRIWKDGTWWLAEAPIFDVMTQARTRKAAHAMLADAIESHLDRPGFRVRVIDRGGDMIGIESDEVAALFAFALRRLRWAHGLSIADVAAALGESSKTGYARYEQGLTMPALDKAIALLEAVAPDAPVVLGLGTAVAPRSKRKAAPRGRHKLARTSAAQ